jgi:hypothetical protein
VFFWFVGLSVAIVWLVFRSPALDYRLVALGAVLPLGDLVTGGVWVLHTLVAAVVVLLAVVLFTSRRRLLRRRWVGLPIGMFLHLVLDGMWTRTEAFWWPLFGWDALGERAPELSRGPVLLILGELAGLVALWWLVRTFDLADGPNRERLIRTGRLPRDAGGAGGRPGEG